MKLRMRLILIFKTMTQTQNHCQNTHYSDDFVFTGRNEVFAKVIFSQACVILSTGGGVCAWRGGLPGGGVSAWRGGFLQIFLGGCLPGGGVPPNFGGGVCLEGGFLQILGGVCLERGGWGGFLQIFWGGCLPGRGGGSPPEYGQRSAGTHPTGMHSCIEPKILLFGNCFVKTDQL